MEQTPLSLQPGEILLGRAHPSLVMDVQVLVTQADRVTSMEREMGHPPRIIRRNWTDGSASGPRRPSAPGAGRG